MFKKLALAIFIVLAIPVSFANAGWVDGYWKTDGTYVAGYWRSNPNGLKYDNYSFDGNWSDAFNDSYFSPTKNYSSDWYTPSWVTQSDYNIGKNFYDTRNNYKSYSYDLFSNDYSYNYRNDPIYTYKPSYNYGYNSYTPSYKSYSAPSYTSPSYNTYNSYGTTCYSWQTYCSGSSYGSGYDSWDYNSYDYDNDSYNY